MQIPLGPTAASDDNWQFNPPPPPPRFPPQGQSQVHRRAVLLAPVQGQSIALVSPAAPRGQGKDASCSRCKTQAEHWIFTVIQLLLLHESPPRTDDTWSQFDQRHSRNYVRLHCKTWVYNRHLHNCYNTCSRS